MRVLSASSRALFLVFEREASLEASSSSRGGASATGSGELGKTRALASVEPQPRGALGASSRDAPSLDLSRRETRRSAARNAKPSEAVCRSVSSSRVTQGATATTALSAPQTVAIMVKQRRRSAAAVGFQNIEVVPSEALESALRERGQLCKHGEAWARRIGASDDPQKLKAFTGLWWDLSPQMRSWDVPPDDGSKCQKCNISASRRVVVSSTRVVSRRGSRGWFLFRF